MVTYDPRYSTWEQWCSLMAELFAPQQLGTVPEEQWQEWGAGMIGIGYFSESGIPDPRSYNNWQDWASALVGILTIARQ